jgi:hypothetical protein
LLTRFIKQRKLSPRTQRMKGRASATHHNLNLIKIAIGGKVLLAKSFATAIRVAAVLNEWTSVE